MFHQVKIIIQLRTDTANLEATIGNYRDEAVTISYHQTSKIFCFSDTFYINFIFQLQNYKNLSILSEVVAEKTECGFHNKIGHTILPTAAACGKSNSARLIKAYGIGCS